MLPAATSCSSGFHKWVRERSISVMLAFLRLPSLSPSPVTNSRPAAPPPTTTMWCSVSSCGFKLERGFVVPGTSVCLRGCPIEFYLFPSRLCVHVNHNHKLQYAVVTRLYWNEKPKCDSQDLIE